jgi:hypothetical protein
VESSTSYDSIDPHDLLLGWLFFSLYRTCALYCARARPLCRASEATGTCDNHLPQGSLPSSGTMQCSRTHISPSGAVMTSCIVVCYKNNVKLRGESAIRFQCPILSVWTLNQFLQHMLYVPCRLIVDIWSPRFTIPQNGQLETTRNEFHPYRILITDPKGPQRMYIQLNRGCLFELTTSVV